MGKEKPAVPSDIAKPHLLHSYHKIDPLWIEIWTILRFTVTGNLQSDSDKVQQHKILLHVLSNGKRPFCHRKFYLVCVTIPASGKFNISCKLPWINLKKGKRSTNGIYSQICGKSLSVWLPDVSRPITMLHSRSAKTAKRVKNYDNLGLQIKLCATFNTLVNKIPNVISCKFPHSPQELYRLCL